MVVQGRAAGALRIKDSIKNIPLIRHAGGYVRRVHQAWKVFIKPAFPRSRSETKVRAGGQAIFEVLHLAVIKADFPTLGFIVRYHCARVPLILVPYSE